MQLRTILLFAVIYCVQTITVRAQFTIAGDSDSSFYFHDIIPDAALHGEHNHPADTLSIDINGDNTFDCMIRSCDCSGLGSQSPRTDIIPLNGSEIAFGYIDTCHYCSSTFTRKMGHPYSAGDSINSQTEWVDTIITVAYNYLGHYQQDTVWYTCSCTDNPFSGSASHYIGIRMFVSGNMIYGWIKVSSVGMNNIIVEEYGGGRIHVPWWLSVSELNTTTCYLYPNPVADVLVVKTLNPKGEYLTITIRDIFGSALKQTKQKNISKNEIEVADIPCGTYFIEISSEYFTLVKKVVKL